VAIGGGEGLSISHNWQIKALCCLVLALAVLLAGCAVDWNWDWLTPSPGSSLPLPDHAMRIVALDIGQGDAILIISPNGKTMLVDGGNSSQDARDVILPYLAENGFDRLDVLVLTHPDADHVGGLPEVLRSIPVGIGVATGQVHTTQIYTEFLQELQRARDEGGTQIVRGVAGIEIPFDPGVQLQVLGPSAEAVASDDMNNASIVLRLTYAEISVLLTGDAETEEETWMMAQGSDLDAQILKVSHHGSNTASSEAFLDRVDPEVALISCGANNRYGHPHQEVLERLSDHDAEVYRTDLDGTIEVVTDGTAYWVQTER
jgi:competence protein ComEC